MKESTKKGLIIVIAVALIVCAALCAAVFLGPHDNKHDETPELSTTQGEGSGADNVVVIEETADVSSSGASDAAGGAESPSQDSASAGSEAPVAGADASANDTGNNAVGNNPASGTTAAQPDASGDTEERWTDYY